MAVRHDWLVIPVSSVSDWRQGAPEQPYPAFVLLCMGNSQAVEVRDQLAFFSHCSELAPIVILSQPEDQAVHHHLA
jgi:hypothetical protein